MFGLQLGRLGIAGLTSWSPAALWPNGASSPGLWIDPSYPASEFQDSAGTTPVSTIGTVLDSSNPVGLIFDRKGGLAFNAPLYTSDFSGGADGFTAQFTSTQSVAGGKLRSISSGTNSGETSREITCVVGKTYKVTGVITFGTATGIISASTTAYGVGVGSTGYQSTTGTYSFYFVATSTTMYIVCGLGSSTNGAYSDFDSISVREIPGIHLSQSTSAARPVASARKNLLVGTATLSTQSVTVTAIPHTITFSGGGTVTASGTYSGALTSGQTFTPTDGTLTLTVSGSVTLAQLERGSAATTYQAVVSASDYTATGFPVYLKLDGTDDGPASATFPAGTLTSSMDCLIAVRRDSTANAVCGIYNAVADATKFFGMAESGSGSGCVGSGAGTPTVWVDGVQLSGGTAVTRGTLHTALTVGAWHILEFRGLDLSTWTAAGFGVYTSYVLNGALGGIELFAASSDANRNKARTHLAAKVGLTL